MISRVEVDEFVEEGWKQEIEADVQGCELSLAAMSFANLPVIGNVSGSISCGETRLLATCGIQNIHAQNYHSDAGKV